MERARQVCLRLLGYRARTRRELTERLERKGFGATVIGAVLAQLEDAGLLDDEAFARAWVNERLERSPRGAAALRWELRRKGVNEDLVQQTLEREVTPKRELAAAFRIAARYERRAASEAQARPCGERGERSAEVERQLAQALRRRGFSFETIEAVLARLRRGGRGG